MMPELLYTRAIIFRAAVLWAGVRLSIAVVGLPIATLLLPIGLAESIVISGTTLALCAFELQRRGEFLLLANLGFGAETLLLLSAVPIVPLEAAFTIFLSAVS
jgi:hypothetical protein